MARLFITLVLVLIAAYVFKYFYDRSKAGKSSAKHSDPYRTKRKPHMWTEVYETNSKDEADKIITRLREESIDYILFEQGKKDIHGNPMKDLGIIVPKEQLARAQNIISRIPV